MYFKFSYVKDVKTPSRANPGDAGIDFFVPTQFNNGEKYRINPGEGIKIPAGIKIEVPFGYAMIFHNKSGVASGKQLIVGASTVDHNYSGEVHINVMNVGMQEQYISPGDKIIQGIVFKVELPQLIEVPEDELYREVHVAGSRADGGFGSTGTR